ncbi:hypothetical protein AKJ09_10252 [Labilithrix luteola]|uniref:Uncharacterized protein n=1 Tax=Labilithrix luteola TaxID=1391654 RepID=A0A0K1QCW0_9BACT|nr:hypothetical protein [Labilithrix luteola]AKV03589.1 hypothetical protein AKJ09_10252 [Labilithrix luteola]
MRRVFLDRLLVTLALAPAMTACAHDDRRAVIETTARPETRAAESAAPSGPAQYVVADPEGRSVVAAFALGGGKVGFVVDDFRVVAGASDSRVYDGADGRLLGAAKLPNRFGGGYLFWTSLDLYRAATFGGVLEPFVHTNDTVASVSFGPRFVLVRTSNGERWALRMPTGERVPIEPQAIVDIEALDDGRALAYDELGSVFTSMDGGGHWSDVTAQLRASPEHVRSDGEQIWIKESTGTELRLEADGRLAAFSLGEARKPVELRPRDPRWRGSTSPLRAAVTSGVSLDDRTAVVIEAGDVARVDIHSGTILSIDSGRVPPDAECEPLPIANDVVFACASSRPSPRAFVVSHVLDGPIIEHTFPADARLIASDDGGVAYLSTCDGNTLASEEFACVRQPNGSWENFDLLSLMADPGWGALVAWVPRADGRAAVVLSHPPRVLDVRSGTAMKVDCENGMLGPSSSHRVKRRRQVRQLVDRDWTFAPDGRLIGLARDDSVIAIGEDGQVTESPYKLEIASAGAFALGRSSEGRLFQSTDHAWSWVEVAPPPGGLSGLGECSSVGCDLGGFYRVGWAPHPPKPAEPKGVVRPAPFIQRTPPVTLACRTSGPVATQVLPWTIASPEDLGLGPSRLPSSENDDVSFLRLVFPRVLLHPLHDHVGDDGDDGQSLRAVLSGYQSVAMGTTMTVLGPSKDLRALRRTLSFVSPFDPSAQIRKAVFAYADVIAAGRRDGLTLEELLSDDLTDSGALLPVTPLETGSASDFAFTNPRGFLALVRGSDPRSAVRVRYAVRPPQNDESIVSGVALGETETAFLDVDADGVEHVFKLGPNGTTDLFTVNASTGADSAPPNPDALAIGPHGDLVVLRTSSGSEPPSALDAALLLAPGQKPRALAPWSTLRLADDPACKQDTGGYRATLQTIAPWVRLTARELRAKDGPMFARVRWSDKLVCLEGLEMRLPEVTVRTPKSKDGTRDSVTLDTWLVSRGGSFARVGSTGGAEWRQPLECSIAR